MLPWFIYLLISLGELTDSNDWFAKDAAEQQRLESIVIVDTIP